ncbi:MAG: histidine kinase N-terminal 7TM domain-containing protein [Pseudomonadota bacterium]
MKVLASIYCLPFFTAALLIFIVFLYTCTRLKARGAGYLAVACLAASFWSLSEGLLFFGFNQPTKIFLTQSQYLGIAPIPPLSLLFVMTIFGFRRRTIATLRSVLLPIAGGIILLVWANPFHHLVFTSYHTVDIGTEAMLGLNHGPLWWGILAYHYALTAVLSVILLKTMFTRTGIQRAQALVIFAGVSSVWLSNAVYITGYSPVPTMDISPIAFSLVAGAMAWGFFRHNLLDILPIARDEVFRALEDAVLVFDNKNRVIDVNPVAASILDIDVPADAAVGTSEMVLKYPVLQRIADGMRQSVVPIKVDGHKHIYDVRVSPLSDRAGHPLGRVMVMRDITEHKRAEDAILESEARYRQIFDIAPIGIYELDYRTRKIIKVNDAMCDVIGYTREELLADDPLRLLTPDSKARFLKRMDKIAKGQSVPASALLTICKKDGSELELSANTRFVYRGSTIVGETVVVTPRE